MGQLYKRLVYFCFAFFLPLGLFAQNSGTGIGGQKDIFTMAKEKAREKAGPDWKMLELVATEDFSKPQLNQKVWSFFRLGDTVFNSVYQRRFAEVKDGKLLLITDSLAPGLFGSANLATEMNQNWYFKYGYFEVRARQPKAYGNGSAFWMITSSATVVRAVPEPGKYGAEVDIFEYSPTTPDKIYYSLHWNGYGPGSHTLTHVDTRPWTAEPSDTYHTYGLLWTPREYRIYVDGQERIRTDQGVSRVPLFIILGTGTGGFAGDPLQAKGPWPDTFSVDFLKVYKLKPMVYLNSDCDFKGVVSAGLKPGRYSKSQLKVMGLEDNSASGIEIPEGWKVVVFDEDNFKGKSLTINGTMSCFPEDLNDRISSIIVYGPK